MLRGDNLYNVTTAYDVYRLKQEGAELNYDGMTLTRVEKTDRRVRGLSGEKSRWGSATQK